MRPLFVLLAMLGCLLAYAAPSAAQTRPPSFVRTACPPAARDISVRVTCGTVEVPENRANPKTREIKLAVFILGGRGEGAGADPFVFLTGGPGDGAFGFIRAVGMMPEAGRLFERRPLVSFDPRGVGYSEPHQDCTTAPDGSVDDAACVRALRAEGFDFKGFTLRENVADVDAVRQAIGARQFNLYGVSFGSRWALDVLRTYPATVRALVLDGPQPPQTTEDLLTARHSIGAIFRLIRGCEDAPACGQAFPHLRRRYVEGLEAFQAHPVIVDGQRIDGLAIGYGLYAAQYDPYILAALPQAMDQTARGQVPSLLLSGQSFAFVQDVSSSYAVGQLVACGETFRASDVPELTKALKKPGLISLFATDYLAQEQVCALWPHAISPQADFQAVRSNVPTSIFNGQYDPADPLPNALVAASTLPNSTIVTFAGRGHTQFTVGPCAVSIAAAFFETRRETASDTNCARDLPQPNWITTSASRAD